MGKIVLQHDERDCGAACISMIARAYGQKLPLSIARSLTKSDHKGTNLYGLADAGEHLGLESDVLRGNPDELLAGIADCSVTLPAIAHIISDDGYAHFIVIFSFSNGIFVIGDPGKGKCLMTADEFFSKWTGYIVTFKRTDRFQSGNVYPKRSNRYLALLKSQRKHLWLVFLLSVLISALSIVIALYLQETVDDLVFRDASESEVLLEDGYEDLETDGAPASSSEVTPDDAPEIDISKETDAHEDESALIHFVETLSEKVHLVDLSIVFLLIILMYAMQYIIHYIRALIIVKMSKNLDQKLTLSFIGHVLDIPLADATRWQTGEYLSRFSDTASIRNALATVVITLAMDLLMMVVCGGVLFRLEPTMFLISLGMLMAYAVLVLVFRSPVKKSSRKVMQSNARVESYFKEGIDGIETIHAANAEEAVKKTMTEKFRVFLDAVVKNSVISVSQETLVSAIESIGTVLILWIGFRLAMTGSLSFGQLVGFYVFLGYFTEPAKNLIELQPTIQNAEVAAERLNDILDLQPEMRCAKTGEEPNDFNEWSMSHVSFRYGNGELVLKDASMHMRRGEKVAIIGESGSGKTTIAKLLLRFFEPEKGRLLVDNQPLDEIGLSDLRSSIAYVSQNTFLFSDTIRNNLLLGIENIEEHEIEEVCRICQLDDFIRQLPNGLDTVLDENGLNLSGGQRQRLAIARALLKKPQLLILDEATSNLDTVTENAIRDALYTISADIACIIITHRLSRIQLCDRIYLVSNGTIAGEGTHEQLLKENSTYQMLWSSATA